jgi:hypothetical protein
MDTDNPPVTTAKPPPLNSDQLNYLIWRYVDSSEPMRIELSMANDSVTGIFKKLVRYSFGFSAKVMDLLTVPRVR